MSRGSVDGGPDRVRKSTGKICLSKFQRTKREKIDILLDSWGWVVPLESWDPLFW